MSKAGRGRVNHIDLTVRDPQRSFPFYESILGYMGYCCTHTSPRGFDFDIGVHGQDFCSIGIKKAEGPGVGRAHDRYAPGLHHLAFNADSRADVDGFHRHLLQIGATVLDAPADYPEYGDGYYAVFFADPDGLKLEYVYWPAP